MVSVGTNESTADAAYSYDMNGLLHQTTAANGLDSQFSYDGHRLIQLEQQDANGAIRTYEYGYDANQNIVSRTSGGSTENFTYDELDRILTTSRFNEQYTYDLRGNRLTLDSNGPQSIQAKENTFDDRNQLTQVVTDGETVDYRYNGDGLLVERTQDGETTRYYYDGDQIIAEATIVEGVPHLKARYIRGNRLEAIQYADDTKAYVLYNGHGDMVELRDSQGITLNQYDYDVWGNVLAATEQVYNPFRYSGELWDGTTGLQYLRARWYDPSVGRFMNEDAYEGQLDNPLTLNLYTYVENNPLTHWDPMGHESLGHYWDLFTDGFSELGKKENWENSWNVAKTALPEGVETFTVYQIGQENYNALTDNQFNQNDFEAVAILIVNFELSRGGGRLGKGAGKVKSKPYTSSRPSYGKGQVDEVWENAKDVDGKVYDPNTGEELTWDISRSRAGQWDMGHTPENKYSEMYEK